MFVAQSKKGAMAINIVVMMLVIIVSVVIAMAFIKVKPDPKEAGSYRHTLGLGKKKAA